MSNTGQQETLFSIASIKQVEVAKLGVSIQNFKTRTSVVKDTKLETVRNLLEECRKYWGIESVISGTDDLLDTPSHSFDNKKVSRDRVAVIRNCERLLARAQIDCNRDYLLDHIKQTLEPFVERTIVEFNHAQFLTELIIDWSRASQSGTGSPHRETGATPRAEQAEQLEQWRSIISREDQVDATAITNYLDKLFYGSEETEARATSRIAFLAMKRNFRSFSKSLRANLSFTAASLKPTIKALIANDNLDTNKQEILQTFLNDGSILTELADILNLRAKALESWNWLLHQGDVIKAYQRRKINGKYRVYFDIDILDAIMWQDIGSSWASKLKSVARDFRYTAWHSLDTSVISEEDRTRQTWFLGNMRRTSGSVSQYVENLYNSYFLTQLPDSKGESRGYGDDGVAGGQSFDFAKAKGELVNTISSYALISSHVGSPCAVLCSDFKWFGPSLSHTAIFTVLEYFGVSEFWIDAFRKFLHMPYQFEGCPSETRKGGVPISTPISDFFSEVILFIMDFAVNSATSRCVWRMHDDLWYFGPPEETEKAWATMTEFASLFGLEFNEEKTGCVCTVDLPGLPKGSVNHGFLTLNKDIQFEINKKALDEHIVEMKRQIDGCEDVLSKVKAHNYYIKFMLRKLSSPSYAFGSKHTVQVIEAIQRVYNEIFNGNVPKYLASRALQNGDVPRGVWYWPIYLGGLELFDPLVELFEAHETLLNFEQGDLSILEKADIMETAEYEKFEQRYNEREEPSFGIGKRPSKEIAEKLRNEPFMSKDEFLKHRMSCSQQLGKAILKYADELPDAGLECNNRIDSLLKEHYFDSSGPLSEKWACMNTYWRYIVTVYGPTLAEKFGSLELANREMVPIGLAHRIKFQQMRWDA